MPVMKPRFAGATWRFSGVYSVDGVATSLSGASIKATLKNSVADADAAAVASITTASTASGQITLTTGGGVANAGWIANFKPAATVALLTAPPDHLILGLRVLEADADEWVPLPKDPDDPVLVPVRTPPTRLTS